MRKNFDGNILDLDGKEMKETKPGSMEQTPISVKTICVNAILSNDEKRPGEEQIKRYQLAKRINKGGDVEVTAEEIALIKKAVAANFPPIVTGFVDEKLEGTGE